MIETLGNRIIRYAVPGLDVQTFETPGDVHIWRKPRGAKWLWALIIPGGGGGGGGFTGAAASARGGGGGGGSGGVADAWIPLWLLPDRLYVTVGKGGQGGAANTVGGNGTTSWIGIGPNPSGNYNFVLAAWSVGGSGGGGGTAAAGGAAGAGASQNITTGGYMMLATGIRQTSGVAGGAGGSQAGGVGVAANLPANIFLTGGGGGGGTTSADFAGAAPAGTGQIEVPQSEWKPANPPAGVEGAGGPWWWGAPYHIFGFGGSGGGSKNAAVGLKGGRGAYGCGGGGGGGGTTGGSGGDGGDGLIIMAAHL